MEINTKAVFMDIVQVVIVPIVLGILAKSLFRRQAAASVKALPLVSTAAIVLIVAIVVGLNQPKLVTNGLLTLSAVILHNLLGFALGYLFARMFGMDLAKRKAVMLETGMQNSGLGAALAAAHFSPLAAVPSALFSVWHNLSGSALATWFAGRAERQR
jgi:BASS family bile acid:Na+ symporter